MLNDLSQSKCQIENMEWENQLPQRDKWFQHINQTLNTFQDGTKYQRKYLSSKDIRHDMDQKMLWRSIKGVF